MCEVSSHKNEIIWCYRRSRQAAEMPNCVARRIKKIETAVTEVVERSEGADLKDGLVCREVNLPKSAALVVTGVNGRVGVVGVAGGEGFCEPRPDDKLCARRESGEVSVVIPVPVANSSLGTKK
jgi:hypothetical protein